MSLTSPDTKPRISARGFVSFYPELSFYFHLSFRELATMPRWAVQQYADALPRLLAEQQLRAFEASILPHMSDRDRQDTVQRHQSTARGGDGATDYSDDRGDMSKEQVAGMFALSGIGIEMAVPGEK